MNIDKYKSKLLLDFPLLLFFWCLDLRCSCVCCDFWTWLKAEAYDQEMCFHVLQMLLCSFMRVPCCWCWGGGGGTSEAGCYIFCQMSSMYLKPCVKDSSFFFYLCVSRVCVWEGLFFPAFQTRLLFSLSPFYPEFQLACPWEGIQIMHNTILGGAVKHPLLCFSWINHKQLQNIIRSRYFICCLGCKFKNSPAVPPHLSLYIGTASHGAVLEMWFYLSERT